MIKLEYTYTVKEIYDKLVEADKFCINKFPDMSGKERWNFMLNRIDNPRFIKIKITDGTLKDVAKMYIDNDSAGKTSDVS